MPPPHELSMQVLGTMTFGKQIDEAQSHEICDEFVKLGGVWIDTAELYPVPPTPETLYLTESIMGTWLEKCEKEDPEFRSKIALATKIAGPSPSDTHSARPSQDVTAKEITEALEGSLQRMKTSYVDLCELTFNVFK
jgi:aryl-alcohol dehydrogenase-like predicted oxidoreductase